MSTSGTELSTEKQLSDALVALSAGRLVAIPTETVYGLAADACNDAAVAHIYAAKGRPSFNPLIVHVASVAMAMRYVQWNDHAQKLADAFWPGPLTLILPRKQDCPISLLASAGSDTLGIRIPNHPLAQQLLTRFDGGLAAPSANRSGKISPTCAQHVRDEFETDNLMILDGGSTQVGIESTVIDCRQNSVRILRPGSITHTMICEAGVQAQPQQTITDNASPLSAGLLSSHYAPNTKLRMNAAQVNADEALLAFGPEPLIGAATTLNLSETGDLIEAASHLFAYLRELDLAGTTQIAAMPIPMEGIGIAINDRLQRAAA